MRRRGCLVTLGVFALLTLVCCGLAFFVGIPRVRNQIETDIAEALGTEIAAQLPSGELPPGTYPISLAELERQLTGTVDTQNLQTISLATVGDDLEFEAEFNGNQRVTYTGRPVAENGRFVLLDMNVDNDVAEFVLPADQLGDALERGVNNYFAARGLEIASIELEADQIVVEATQ